MGVFLLLSVAGFFALSHGWQRDWLRERIETELAAALDRPVRIEGLEGVLYREISLSGVRVGDESAPIAALEKVRLRFGTPEIETTPVFVVREFSIEGGVFEVLRSETGEWPWSLEDPEGSAGASPESGLPIGLRFDSARITNVRLLVRPMGGDPIGIDLSGDAQGVFVGSTQVVESARATFSVSGVDHASAPWLEGRFEGSVSDGQWDVVEFETSGDVLISTASGRGTAEGIGGVKLDVEIPSIAALTSRFGLSNVELKGQVALSGDLAGPYEWPLGMLKVRATRLKADAVKLGDFVLEVRSASPGTVEIDAFGLKNEFVDLVAEAGGSISVSSTAVALAGLKVQDRIGDGFIGIDANLPMSAGTVADGIGRHSQTRVAVHASDWPMGAMQSIWRLFGAEASGRLDGDLTINGATAGVSVAGALHLRSGRIEYDGNEVAGLDLKLNLRGTPQTRLAGMRADIEALSDRVSISGRDLGALVLSAQVDDGTVTFERFSLENGPVELRVSPGSRVGLNEEFVRFTHFVLEEGSQRIVLNGGVSPLAADHLRVAFSPLEPARIGEILFDLGVLDEEVQAQGRVVGEINWNGPRDAPDLRGDLDWSGTELGGFEFDSVRASVQSEGETVQLSTDWVRNGESIVVATASVPRSQLFVAPETMLQDSRSVANAKIKHFELGSLSPFLPTAVSNLGGVLSVDVEVRGASPNPELSGEIGVEEGSIKLRALAGQVLKPMSTLVRLIGDKLTVERLEIGQGEERIEGSAVVTLDQLRPAAIEADLSFLSYPINTPGLVQGTLSGALKLSGPRDKLDLTGRLDFASIRIQIPDPADPTVKEIRIVSGDGTGPPALRETDDAKSVLDPLRVELELRLARNSWARGRGAEVELRGNLKVNKERGRALSLSGSAQTVRGTYEIYGRRFRVERGQVILDGGDEVDPVIDIRALHRVRGVKIYAIIEGRLSEPRLRFESDPELEETDIASYLLLGRPASGDAGDEQVALESVAAQVALGATLREFEKMFGGALPVDVIDIRVEGEDDESEIRAGVGQYVGDRLFLHYERGFGDEPSDELKAEYELTPIWSVESTVSSEGETGGDLVFEIEY